jgi:hypothetical protein
MDTEGCKPTLAGVCGSTSGEVHGLQVAQEVQGGGDQGGAVGAAAGSAEEMTGFDNGDADEAGSMAWSGSLAVTRWMQSTGLGNGLAC